ncbi:hypothetical protein PHLGIDRAFT_485701 [Phlebiopsis gigantea 11061_1 CR5-6]|uniref:Uncharacterized protein n=1 Tax=Phlebiopsis gigantea (strain 11061_1 CR5-6) TaxID=745531 RepID=A0A0C3RW80_PHLG1|nr:hypothetical protein PHLGIDRAFT_485701 [Phlebiopsis gigantea 11061_1 CR5-6]
MQQLRLCVAQEAGVVCVDRAQRAVDLGAEPRAHNEAFAGLPQALIHLLLFLRVLQGRKWPFQCTVVAGKVGRGTYALADRGVDDDDPTPDVVYPAVDDVADLSSGQRLLHRNGTRPYRKLQKHRPLEEVFRGQGFVAAGFLVPGEEHPRRFTARRRGTRGQRATGPAETPCLREAVYMRQRLMRHLSFSHA